MELVDWAEKYNARNFLPNQRPCIQMFLEVVPTTPTFADYKLSLRPTNYQGWVSIDLGSTLRYVLLTH